MRMIAEFDVPEDVDFLATACELANEKDIALRRCTSEPFIIASGVISLAQYLQFIGLHPSDARTLEEFEELHTDYWNYPLSELEHVVFQGGEYVIVNFPTESGENVYRVCELFC